MEQLQKLKKNIDTSTRMMNMDETEDEEVKRNCFGMKHYESSSKEEESDDDSVASVVERPIKFGCYKPIGIGIVKPTPVPVSFSQNSLDERFDDRNSVKKFQIIHNECEFSEEGSDCEEVIVETTSVADRNELSEDFEGDQFDDYDSDSNSESPTEVCEKDTYYAVEDEDHVSEEDELSSQSELSFSSDADDEFSDIDEASSGEHVDEDSCFKLSTKVSRNTSDEQSVSADEIQNLIEKPEISEDMCFSENEVEVSDEKEMDDDDYYVMKCLNDPDQESLDANIQPLKRLLCTQQTMHVTPDEDDSRSKRSCRRASLKIHENANYIPPYLPVLSLGPTVVPPTHLAQCKRESPQLSISTQEEMVDSQLAEELIDGSSETPVKESDPVPLLTPPSTPIEARWSSGQISICEWPSNLAVDNALTAAIELRPLSPSSLAKLEEQDPSTNDLYTPPAYLQQRLRSVSEISSTGLPAMLGIMGIPSSFNHR